MPDLEDHAAELLHKASRLSRAIRASISSGAFVERLRTGGNILRGLALGQERKLSSDVLGLGTTVGKSEQRFVVLSTVFVGAVTFRLTQRIGSHLAALVGISYRGGLVPMLAGSCIAAGSAVASVFGGSLGSVMASSVLMANSGEREKLVQALELSSDKSKEIERHAAERWPFLALVRGMAQVLQNREHADSSLVLGLTCAAGVLGATLFGGPRRLLHSDVGRPGAFTVLSRPATERYASERVRKWITTAGRNFGCHHCGSHGSILKKNTYVADHIPPLKYVRERKLPPWLQWLFRPLPEKIRFYPQCTTCCKTQADAVRQGVRRYVAPRATRWRHWGPVPPYFLYPLLAPVVIDVRNRYEKTR